MIECERWAGRRCSRRNFQPMSISIAASSALRPRQGAPAACADSPWNWYSTETSPVPRPPPQDTLEVVADVREQHHVHVLEEPVADEPRLRADQLLGDARPEHERPGNVLALHDLLHRERGRHVHGLPRVVAFAVARRALDDRVVLRDAGLLARLRDAVDVRCRARSPACRSPSGRPTPSGCPRRRSARRSRSARSRSTRYFDVSTSWKPSSEKLKILSTMTCVSFRFDSTSAVTSFSSRSMPRRWAEAGAGTVARQTSRVRDVAAARILTFEVGMWEVRRATRKFEVRGPKLQAVRRTDRLVVGAATRPQTGLTVPLGL